MDPVDPFDECPRTHQVRWGNSQPARHGIYPASVYSCDSTQQAESLLSGSVPGYVYQRDGHPNADLLAQKCGILHGADRAAITPSGMSAFSLAFLSLMEAGDNLLISDQLYGRTTLLAAEECRRFGIKTESVDITDHQKVADAIVPRTRMLIVETIANPLLRVADIQALAKLAHEKGCLLVVDNTFASPVVCRPLEWGADLVVESISKIMNGHSDVMLGMLAGRKENWSRVDRVQAAWGFNSSPFDCWLAERGIGTLAVRIVQASQNAARIAKHLQKCKHVVRVDYPGLSEHPDHSLAAKQFDALNETAETLFGHVVTFHLDGKTNEVNRFIQHSKSIHLCPSLGELGTTLSHPLSTSHRSLSSEAQTRLGINAGTIRLSVGLESFEFIRNAIDAGLSGLD
jgi:cystathionine beta-lyase/cystathionine gamma-synthase